MILTKEQINRYLRHIIMPEISGQGQKKLLESTVFIYGENVKEIIPLTLYLSAMGIGNIYCYFEDETGYTSLFSNVMDLNNDVKIELLKNNEIRSDFRILLGNYNFIKRVSISIMHDVIFIPTIISMINQWKSSLQLFKESQELIDFVEFLGIDLNIDYSTSFVSGLSGTLCSIEGIKLILNIGNACNELLICDLYDMNFNSYKNDEINKALKDLNSTDYEEINYENIKENLSKAKVLIVGAGGLGSPAALALTMAGIGTIGLLDSDIVEASNLNRQVLHSISRLGMPKVESAKFFLKEINSKIDLITHIENLSKENAIDIIKNYDLVVSAVDNIQTRYLINDLCYFMKKTVIEAGVLRFDGTNTTIIPDEGHCYRCLYPKLSTSAMSCAETGVLGAVPGVMGFIQAAEVYKIIAEIGTTLKNKILLFDGLEMEFNVISLDKNPNCPLCGENPTIKDLQDYTIKCSSE